MSSWRAKALVVYESFHGNTARVAEAIGRGLAARFDVEVVEVSQAPLRPQVDLLVVGAPVHAASAPNDETRAEARKQVAKHHGVPLSQGAGVREWLDQLATRPHDVAAAAFDTVIGIGGVPFGSAARFEVRALQEHGYYVIEDPQHFFVTPTDHPELREGELERAVAWGARIAEDVLGVRPSTEPPLEEPAS